TVSGTYTGTLGAGEKIQVSADGTTWVDAIANGADHTWSASGVTLSGTGTSLSVRTIDTAGNTTAGTAHSYTLDTLAPSVAISSQTLTNDTGTTGDRITSDGHVTLSGTVESGSTVAIYNGATKIGDATVSGTSWSFWSILAEGSYALAAKATDVAGNTTTTLEQPTIVVDATAPSAPTIALATDSG